MHRHIDLKDLFLDWVAGKERIARDYRSSHEIALEDQVQKLVEENRDMKEHAIHWEGAAARDLARAVAALYTTARARLDATVASGAIDQADSDPGNVSSVTARTS